jgi:hypothetical protein
MERNGLKDVKNVDRVIKDVIDDRISMEKDLVRTFESFKFFESDEYKVISLRQCLYKGIDKSNIHHEKILADHFDVSLSHIDIINSDKHIFKIETLNGDLECVIYTQNELEIIKENMEEYCLDQIFNKKIKLEGIGVDIQVNIKEFIDKEKFTNHIAEMLSMEKVFDIIEEIYFCDDVVGDNNFIGLYPKYVDYKG